MRFDVIERGVCWAILTLAVILLLIHGQRVRSLEEHKRSLTITLTDTSLSLERVRVEIQELSEKLLAIQQTHAELAALAAWTLSQMPTNSTLVLTNRPPTESEKTVSDFFGGEFRYSGDEKAAP